MKDLTKIYGDTLLKFLLATNDLDEALTPNQQATLSVLTDLAARTAQEDGEPSFVQLINLSGALGRYLPDRGTTLSWALRLQSGGDLHEVEHDDELTRNLLVAARDLWPALLLPPSAGPFYDSRTPSTYPHPSGRKAMHLLLEDEHFRTLFPDAKAEASEGDNIFETQSYLTYSSGRGGSFQLALIPDVLIGNARARQFLGGQPDSVAEFLERVVEVLQEAQQLAAGKEIYVPKLVGFANMDVAGGVEVQMPFGTLRGLQPGDERLLPQASAAGGAQVTAVLQTVMPLKIVDRRSWPEVRDESPEQSARSWEKLSPTFERAFARSERTTMMTRYAALLSSDSTLLAPVQLSHAALEPLQYGVSQSSALFVGQPSGTGMLDSDAAERMKLWAEKIHENHPSNLDLGVRRILSAAGVRLDPIDGFIDAVICWENMFGSSTESTFRICGAMACLLEPNDKAKRLGLFNSLKKLYETRSLVVHGAKELGPQIASAHRTESIWRALESMRQLYSYPDLLSAEGSANRGRDTLLRMGVSIDVEPTDELDKEEDSAAPIEDGGS